MTSLQPSLRRLLNRRDVTECLAHLEPLAVALVDFNGRTFVTVGEVPERDTIELSLPLMVAGSVVGDLVARGSELEQPVVESAVRLAHRSLNLLLASRHESRSLARETLERYREINLLYSIGETIGATLDPDAIPHLILAEAGRVINADAGAVFLKEEGELRMRASVGASDLLLALQVENATEIADTSEDGLPCILTREQLSHPRPEVTAVVCAPLKTREQVLGLVMLGRLAGSDVFTASDQKLLSALAGQTAIAIENARLFADVKDQRDAIAEMKKYMDNIFASIASGVITTDISDLVTILNRAAERILGVRAEDTMGRPYTMALPQLSRELAPLVSTVKQRDRGVFGYEMESVLPERGPVNLRFHLSPLKDHQEHTTGIA
ncbi:MAG: GAF domain-containing protein, partial [Anaerolineae bacterium]